MRNKNEILAMVVKYCGVLEGKQGGIELEVKLLVKLKFIIY
jgi:hypothetical protein